MCNVRQELQLLEPFCLSFFGIHSFMPFMEFIDFWNMYYAAMINIDKIVECYLFNTVLREIPNIWSFVEMLKFYCHDKFPFFQEILSYFQNCCLQSDHLFSLNCVNLYTNAYLLLYFFISVLVIIFFNILPNFLANIFFLPYHVCKQFICIFRPCKQFFSIFLIPLLQKK